MNHDHLFRSDTALAVHARGFDLSDMRDEVLRGLGKPSKELPAKLFYDDIGSQLFDRICELDEYYLTRAETAIMREHAGEMATIIGGGCLLIEFGSGSSRKTRILLDCMRDVLAYVAIDISREHLMRAMADLASAYPRIAMIPVWADYTAPFDLPPLDWPAARKVAYFPGSTIGNFYPAEAVDFMKGVARLVGPGGSLLIGVDLKKDPAMLHRAYNDHAGVTAAFNRNMLARLNRDLGADFRIDRFLHRAFYNQREGRIEMHLISAEDQVAHVNGAKIAFEAGESILTEVSYKYTTREFARLASRAGFTVRRVWTDADRRFSVQYLIAS
jgi:dimethylhistidine N-methyltransferase